MDIMVYDIQYDEVIKSFYIIAGVTYEYSVKKLYTIN